MIKKKTRKPRMTKRMKHFAAQMAQVQNFTIKDFQRNCIVRGMPFEDMLDADMGSLRVWLHHNAHNEIKPELLDEFDKWKEGELKKSPNFDESYLHPSLRLGFMGEEDEDGNVKKKRIKGFKKPKKKRERTEDGIYAGTKKALTYACAKEDLSLEETVEKVTEVFPDAKAKSINIWFKRAKRETQKEA